LCICCRVTDINEDLFHGNMAPTTPSPYTDHLNGTLEGFCLCDGSRQCGRRAVSDTTADDSEPQRNVRLGVPKISFLKRRRKRQASGRGDDELSGGSRIYDTDYEYEFHCFVVLMYSSLSSINNLAICQSLGFAVEYFYEVSIKL